MRFSNAGFEDISPQEYDRQEALIAALVAGHHQEWVQSGGLDRVIESPATCNILKTPDPVMQTTVVRPRRTTIAGTSHEKVLAVAIDTGFYDRASDDVMTDICRGPNRLANYILQLRRIDSYPGRTVMTGYNLGFWLSGDIVFRHKLPPFLPIIGVEIADLERAARQLTEISEAASLQNLSIIDPVTLFPGKGVELVDSD